MDLEGEFIAGLFGVSVSDLRGGCGCGGNVVEGVLLCGGGGKKKKSSGGILIWEACVDRWLLGCQENVFT